MNILVDQQLPPMLASWLVSQGVSAVHVREIGLASAADSEISREAVRRSAVVLTKDDDFVRLLYTTGQPPVIWIRIGNCSTAVLLARFQANWRSIRARIEDGDRLVEVR